MSHSDQDHGEYSGASQHIEENGPPSDGSQTDMVLANILPSIRSLIEQGIQSSLAPNRENPPPLPAPPVSSSISGEC